MKKELRVRCIIISSIMSTAALVVLVSNNFSNDAIITVATTLGLGVCVTVLIAWLIVRKSRT